MRVLITLLLCCSLLGACGEAPKKATLEVAPVGFMKEGELKILREDSVITSLDIEIAENDYETQTGLMYRESMEDSQGMLFIFPNEEPRSFYMKNTRIALDLIFIQEDGRIVSIVENARPLDETGIPSGAPAQYVLEVIAGFAADHGIQAGDRIDFERMEP